MSATRLVSTPSYGVHTHEDEEETSPLHLYCRLFVQRGPWFALDNLYGRYYEVARREVGRGRSDSNTDADTDDEREAREEDVLESNHLNNVNDGGKLK